MFIVVSLFGGIFWYYHPTHYKYNDRFIIGSSIEEITSKYGDFDKVFYTDTSNTTLVSAGYLVQQEKKGYLGTSPEKYYMIVFDSTGKAISVSIGGGWGG
jgi:hypothetical protein